MMLNPSHPFDPADMDTLCDSLDLTRGVRFPGVKVVPATQGQVFRDGNYYLTEETVVVRCRISQTNAEIAKALCDAEDTFVQTKVAPRPRKVLGSRGWLIMHNHEGYVFTGSLAA